MRFPLSASVGIATGCAAESAEQLLHRADQAMYRAKSLGPGRCEFADGSEEPGGSGALRRPRVRPSRGGFEGPIPVM